MVIDIQLALSSWLLFNDTVVVSSYCFGCCFLIKNWLLSSYLRGHDTVVVTRYCFGCCVFVIPSWLLAIALNASGLFFAIKKIEE